MFGKNQLTNLNILIITQYFWPENFRINELSSELKKRGNKVTVLTGIPNYPEGKVYDFYLENKKKFSSYKGVEIIRVPLIARRQNKLFLLFNYLSFCISASTLGYYKLRDYKFDVVFVFQTSPVLVGIPSSIFSYFRKIPQILWVLDLWPESLEAVDVIKSKWQLSFLRLLVNNIYKRCEIILCQSKSFAKEISKSIKRPEKIAYFPAWSDVNFLKVAKDYAPEIDLKKSHFNIIFAGNIGEAQDFQSIIKAFQIISKKNLKKIRLIVIGEGSMKKWLIAQIKINNLNHIIEVHQKYPLYRMPSFFKHADALLVSLTDKKVFSMTIPGKIQSYLASGIPIIAMINGEGANIIKKARAGKVCEAGKFKKLANIIEKLSKESDTKLKEYGVNGRKYANKEFNRDKLIDKLNNIFVNLVGKEY